MSDPSFANDINLLGVGQLLNTRIHNVNGSIMSALSNELTTANTGMVVFNVDDSSQYIWNGSMFVSSGSGGVSDIANATIDSGTF